MFAAISEITHSHTLLNVLGILTGANALLIFLSCRLVPMLGERMQLKFTQNKVFRFIYKYHTYYWWTFWLILALHAMVGIGHNLQP